MTGRHRRYHKYCGDKPETPVVTYPGWHLGAWFSNGEGETTSDEFTPNGQDVPAKHGETPKAEDGIATKVIHQMERSSIADTSRHDNNFR